MGIIATVVGRALQGTFAFPLLTRRSIWGASLVVVFFFLLVFGLLPLVGLGECKDLLEARTETPAGASKCAIVVRDALFDKLIDFDRVPFYLAYLLFAFALFSAIYRYLKPSNREMYLYPIVACFVIILCDLYLFMFSLKVADPELIGAAVLGLFAAFYFFATMVTSVETNRHAVETAATNAGEGRKENFTLNLILNMRSDNLLNWHRENLLAQIPTGVQMSLSRLAEVEEDMRCFDRQSPSSFVPNDVPLFESLVYLLNYYEFIATGIRKEIIDRKLIELTVGSVIYNFYEKVEVFVDWRIEISKAAIKKKQLAVAEKTMSPEDLKTYELPEPRDHIYSDLERLITEWREQGIWFAEPKPKT